MAAERKASMNLECGICLQVILRMGRKFGLLTDCNHSFCLEVSLLPLQRDEVRLADSPCVGVAVHSRVARQR
jgi:hypothetical protein